MPFNILYLNVAREVLEDESVHGGLEWLSEAGPGEGVIKMTGLHGTGPVSCVVMAALRGLHTLHDLSHPASVYESLEF